jgi:GT2 family glycosyltransferase
MAVIWIFLLAFGVAVVFSALFFRRLRNRGRGISILIPFRAVSGSERDKNVQWLLAYWKSELPGAELILGSDDSIPFCKTAAVNQAAANAKGDVLALLDADAYLPAERLIEAAKRIRQARRQKRPLWIIPYRRLYRLVPEATRAVRESDPKRPLRLPDPPPGAAIEPGTAYESYRADRGHWYGAMATIVPREAFERLNGMDERFHGWGGEDVAFMRALDTIYGPHKTLTGSILHMHHPKISSGKFIREWEGQERALMNGTLSVRYLRATGDPEAMRRLLDERFSSHPVK